MAKNTTDYTAVTRNTTNYGTVSKNTANLLATDPANATAITLGDATVTLGSTTYYLTGFTTTSVPNMLHRKVTTNWAEV